MSEIMPEFKEIMNRRMEEFIQYKRVLKAFNKALEEVEEYLSNEFDTKVTTEIKKNRINVIMKLNSNNNTREEERRMREMYDKIGRQELGCSTVDFGYGYVKYGFMKPIL